MCLKQDTGLFELMGSGPTVWSCGLWLLTLCWCAGHSWVLREVRSNFTCNWNRRGRHNLITSAGPGPRPPGFKHLSITGEARGALIGIIHELFGASWCVVLAVSRCSRLGGAVWGALRLFWTAGDGQWPGQLLRPPCGALGVSGRLSKATCW